LLTSWNVAPPPHAPFPGALPERCQARRYDDEDIVSAGCQAPPVGAARFSAFFPWESEGAGWKIRNDMMAGSFYEPSQNVILSEARRRRAKSKDLCEGRAAFLIPNSIFHPH